MCEDKVLSSEVKESLLSFNTQLKPFPVKMVHTTSTPVWSFHNMSEYIQLIKGSKDKFRFLKKGDLLQQQHTTILVNYVPDWQILKH